MRLSCVFVAAMHFVGVVVCSRPCPDAVPKFQLHHLRGHPSEGGMPASRPSTTHPTIAPPRQTRQQRSAAHIAVQPPFAMHCRLARYQAWQHAAAPLAPQPWIWVATHASTAARGSALHACCPHATVGRPQPQQRQPQAASSPLAVSKPPTHCSWMLRGRSGKSRRRMPRTCPHSLGSTC